MLKREGRKASFLSPSPSSSHPQTPEVVLLESAAQARITLKWVDLREILHLPSCALSSPFRLFRLTTTTKKKLEGKKTEIADMMFAKTLLCTVQS